MKRTAVGLIAMSGIALAVSSPAAGSAAPASLRQAPASTQTTQVAPIDATGSGSAVVNTLRFLLECLTTGSGTPGTTGTGCLVS
ncbi:hypothetical protein [Nocardia aurantiaca]|uniref:Uncharacterized protein n=1 Tax=Nocardia aurantiaca TaxID=2675850 RepID=A0A6I3L0N3_9NOCA|nr:hypothetical protein [Nocardia aurantiaca]MTE16543.1 hypothetical protein [Nocardia aurantiaca]